MLAPLGAKAWHLERLGTLIVSDVYRWQAFQKWQSNGSVPIPESSRNTIQSSVVGSYVVKPNLEVNHVLSLFVSDCTASYNVGPQGTQMSDSIQPQDSFHILAGPSFQG